MEVILGSNEPLSSLPDRAQEMQEFQETQAGVKGLVDSGLAKIPRMFVHGEDLLFGNPTNNNLQVPIIDLQGLENGGGPMEIVDQVRQASETWGFFQVINHGIPVEVMDQLLKGQKQFHEQSAEAKKGFFFRDRKQSVKFHSNSNTPDSQPALWRDTLTFSFKEDALDSDALPSICREAIVCYLTCLLKLRDKLAELLSEGLGLSRDYLRKIGCMKGGNLMCHYHPKCPEPNLTLGSHRHSDPDFLTILLQDDIGGLQVLHQNQWVDVPPTRGALVVNIGDFMQLISNGKVKSVQHRVVIKSRGPRLSAACGLNQSSTKAYGPLKEFISDTNPPIYREIVFSDYLSVYKTKWMEVDSVLILFQV